VIVRLIFAVTYLVLAFGRLPFLRVDRTAAAVIGAIAMIAAGGLTLDQAYRAIDYRTLILLFGMMVLVATLRLGAFFRTLGHAIVARIDHPALLLVAVIAASGVLSALFVNDTICLVFTPILIEICAVRRQNPLPFLLALATASNIGSTATITGNPPMASTLAGNLTLLGSIANLIVAEGARREGIRVGFVDYLKVGVPVTLVTLAFGVWWLG